MTSPDKKAVGIFDVARQEDTGIASKPEEGVFLSPWGTEGCQWDLDYSYLEDDDPPAGDVLPGEGAPPKQAAP